MKRVVLASHNKNKLKELQRILAEPFAGKIELIGYDGPEPKETGLTFAENSLLKARAAAAHTGLPAIADDSGLVVQVLGGSPGIFSARWAGKNSSDEANLNLLLEQLADIEDAHRVAEFVCVASLALPDDQKSHGEAVTNEFTATGVWGGKLLRHASGSSGFGYDPIFVPQGETKTAAEMLPAEKDADSHRTRAFLKLAPVILNEV